MMNSNKQILKYCPNFYKIINFNPIEGDKLTEKIIELYKSYIFRIDVNNIDEVNEIKELDSAIIKYINDYLFRKEVQDRIVKVKIKKDGTDIIKYFIDFIINIFTNYDEYTTRNIYVSRWI